MPNLGERGGTRCEQRRHGLAERKIVFSRLPRLGLRTGAKDEWSEQRRFVKCERRDLADSGFPVLIEGTKRARQAPSVQAVAECASV